MKRSLLKIFGKKDKQEKVVIPAQPQEADINLPADLYTFVYLTKPAAPTDPEKDVPADLYTFVYMPECKGWIGTYPVTNLQYQRFLEASDFGDRRFWVDFPKYGPPPDYELQGTWGEQGWQWLQDLLKDHEVSPDGQRVVPRKWHDKNYGIQRPLVPVVSITWFEANAYCRWLQAHWSECEEAQENPELRAGVLRLPTEVEWVEAAGGDLPANRYAWDPPGKATTDIDEIIRRANLNESRIMHTTPVSQYPLGQSPLGIWDMTGNVWEWQANIYDAEETWLVERGGGWRSPANSARMSDRKGRPLDLAGKFRGFRLFFSPS